MGRNAWGGKPWGDLLWDKSLTPTEKERDKHAVRIPLPVNYPREILNAVEPVLRNTDLCCVYYVQIAVPRSGSLHGFNFTDSDYETHTLIPVEHKPSVLMTLNGKVCLVKSLYVYDNDITQPVVKVREVSGRFQTPCFRYRPPYLKTRPRCYTLLNWAMSEPCKCTEST